MLYEERDDITFKNSKGFSAIENCPPFNKPIFQEWGVESNNKYQVVQGISFYPSGFFEGFEPKTREVKITENTRTVHHYTGLGHPNIDRWYMFYRAKLVKKYSDDEENN